MRSTYAEWAVPTSLAAHLACTWARELSPGPTAAFPNDSVVTPDGCIDIIWNGDRLFVAGPDTGPHQVSATSGTCFAGARFRPGMASTILGVPASSLLDDRVDLADLLPGVATLLADDLLALPGGRSAAVRIESELASLLPNATTFDRTVVGAVRMLRRQSMSRPVAVLAGELGVSERQLLRRCRSAIGYGPKMLDRVLRFRRFSDLLADAPSADLAGLAAAAGYADQAHLSRECRAMTGTTPSKWSETFKTAPPVLATLEQ